MRKPASRQVEHVGSSRARGAADIHVCSLDRLWWTVEREHPTHVITLLHNADSVATASVIDTANHLRLSMHDISAPSPGMVQPGVEHVQRILTFARAWDRSAPMVVHCLAGISRSTATAFITACALNPHADVTAIAQRIRVLSPTASPNILLVEIADDLLGRGGRMVSAIEDIGYGEPASEGWPFALPSTWPEANSV